jgi:hypothetical protein
MANGGAAVSIEQEVQESEPSAKETLTRLVEAANREDEGSAEALREWLDQHPETWQEAGDLAAHVEKTWLRKASGGNMLLEESIHREAARIRRELSGASPTTLEKLLIDQVVACWLQLHHAQIAAGSDCPKNLMQARFHDQRLECSQRRYFAAMKMLAQVRGLPVSALMSVTPAADSTQAAETVAQAADEGPSGAVGEPVDPSSVASDADPGYPLRILPESRKAV